MPLLVTYPAEGSAVATIGVVTKVYQPIWTNQKVVASAVTVSSVAIPLATARQISLNVRMINAYGAPGVGCQIGIYTSNNGADFYNYGGALLGGVLAGGNFSWGGITFPDGVQYLKLSAGNNTTYDVVVDADISYVA